MVLKRQLPLEFGGGSLFVSPEGGLKFWRNDLSRTDPALLRIVSDVVRSSHVVWDIGANIGLFTYAAAGIAGPGGRVVALEPDTWLVDLLRRSTHLNGTPRAPVDILAVAACESIGVDRFCVARRSRAASHLQNEGTSQAGGTREEQLVPSVTLDHLLGFFPAPNVLKIDVEGAEYRVLAGAERILSKIRPVIICEVSPQNVDRVSKLLISQGYTIFDADLDRVARKASSKAFWNTLAYPNPSLA